MEMATCRTISEAINFVLSSQWRPTVTFDLLDLRNSSHATMPQCATHTCTCWPYNSMWELPGWWGSTLVLNISNQRHPLSFFTYLGRQKLRCYLEFWRIVFDMYAPHFPNRLERLKGNPSLPDSALPDAFGVSISAHFSNSHRTL